MTHKQLEEYVLSKVGAWLDYPFGEDVAVYKVGSRETGKMFALIPEGKEPVRVSLKCDPQLAEKLRETYESVQPGYHLNKKHWNTIICSGQVPDTELFALIDLSHRLAGESLGKAERLQLGL
ncbi:MmcQ/YjbR family DNA-binding protein [Candidatus Saccharibacteria bacterium]|nr:MmcQ/YjbR family DNA-binding protein [Candidatus Saccharibacteria bacterium]